MPKKILAVFGATGQQGSSVIAHILNDPELSSQFHLRAITRDINSPKATHLKSQNIEVVHGDVLNPQSLTPALRDAHTVFAMTAYNPTAPNSEYTNGKDIADAAVSAGAKYLIWSTLPSIAVQSGGKYTTVIPFDDKARVQVYIRNDLRGKIKSSSLVVASFMENFIAMAPKLDPASKKWVIKQINSPQSKLALIAVVEDMGKFVGKILAEPDRYEGRTVNAAQGRYSFEEIAASIGKATGREVVYQQIGVEEFKENTPFMGDVLVEIFRYFEEFGLYGADEEEIVFEAREDVRGGSLMGLDEFFVKYPVKLE